MKTCKMGIVAALSVLIINCGGGGGGKSSPPSFSEVTATGWNLFQNASYDSALTFFDEAIADFATLSPDSLSRAYAGRGWCYGRLSNYSSALADFALAGATNQDAVAGSCFANLALNNYTPALTAGNSLVSLNASYSFTYDNSITAADVRLAIAQASFYLQSYSTVITQLNIIAPGHGLTASSPPADILAKLMQLRSTI